MFCVAYHLAYLLILYIIQPCIGGSRTLHKPGGLTYLHTEINEIHFTNITFTTSHDRESARGKLPEILPISFNARVRVRDTVLSLHFYKNPKLSSNVPVYLRDATSRITAQRASDQLPNAFYQDVSHMASMHVECLSNVDEERCSEFEFFGTFYLGQEIYIIESESGMNHRTNTTRSCTITQPFVPLRFVNDHSSEHLTSSFSTQGRTGRSKRASGLYRVELFVVVDYSVYKYWYDASSQTSIQGRKNDALNTIKTFVAFHINGIDARYASLNLGYTMDVSFAGIYIAENITSSPWTEPVKTVSNTVNVVTVINNFRLWIQAETQAENIPAHDHAMLFSRYNFISNGDDGNIGYAFQAGMCSDNSQSIVEDQFNFIVETTAAHELGHSLGAKHDGVDNNCLANNAYVMAASSSSQTGTSARHPWIFSSCSVIEINNLLDNLDSNGNNCLLTTDSSTNPDELNPYTVTEIGQLFNVNLQCELAVGQGSYICLQFYTDFETICTGLWCKTLSSSSCTLILPADGTTCNTAKWCQQGNCVASNSAPTPPSTCLYGDSKGVVYNTLTCQDMAKLSPWGCYSYNSSCCDTCQSLYTGQNGCEYGDKTNCTQVSANQCYAGTNADICCRKCQSFNTGIQGCEYGDRTNCTGVTGSQCYVGDNSNICCQTCLTFYTAIPGCLYGDKALGCQQGMCRFYNQADLDSCCLTCYNGTLPSTPGLTTTSKPVTTPVPTTQETTVEALPTTTTTSTTETPDLTTIVSSSSDTTVPINSTTSSGRENPQGWVIPVVATAVGVVFILVLVGTICYFVRTRKAKTAKATGRGPSTISQHDFGGARTQSFSGIANIAYQVESVPGPDHYDYISPQNVSGPRVSKQMVPPGCPLPRRPPQPSIKPSTGPHPSSIKSHVSHEYVEVTDYQALGPRHSTKSTAYKSLKNPKSGAENSV
ncbi:uncharacterized protein LOC132550664 [Ylistrum balloti]|uniref:uncharacterized protein LOC132550664 n=1 Tax=Ylistrum balloti TaxID=509963 RepID=UPI0029058372|nr:uncharacterized protein LOC132550664 [Ylistrum balloti]